MAINHCITTKLDALRAKFIFCVFENAFEIHPAQSSLLRGYRINAVYDVVRFTGT